MKQTLLILSLCLVNVGFSQIKNTQISVDSLLFKINSNYSKSGKKDYLGEKFTKFETKNKEDRYDLFLDSTNQLNNHIGLSIVHYSYDKLKRIKLIEGFDSIGFRRYWDFPIIQKYVEEIIRVEESEIVEALRLHWERMKIVTEPSCAVPLAALLRRKTDFKGKRIGIIISGGNVDISNLPF